MDDHFDNIEYRFRKYAAISGEYKGEDANKLNTRNNVIVYNVSESRARSFNENAEENRIFCQDLMNEVLKVGHVEGDFE